MNPFSFLKPHAHKEIPFLILVSFLATFILSRLIVILLPQIFLEVKGYHVHHYSYGIFFLAISNLILLLQPRSKKTRIRMGIFYGFSLGLVFDEFFMWLVLQDDYWHRKSLDAILIVSLILLSTIYFGDFWQKWGKHLNRLLDIIFLKKDSSPKP